MFELIGLVVHGMPAICLRAVCLLLGPQVHSSYATDLTALNMSMPHPSNATRVKIQTTDVSACIRLHATCPVNTKYSKQQVALGD